MRLNAPRSRPGFADPTVRNTQAQLDYLVETSCHEQWRVFLSEFVSEFYAQVEPELAEGFLTRLGERMAKAMPLVDCQSLEDVESALNETLLRIRWGWVRLEEAGHHIRILHGAFPVVPVDDPGLEGWLIPVLEGVHTSWLNAVGGDPSFRAVAVGSELGGPNMLEFIYGRQD